jgi:ERCC4-type nuclease
VLKEVSIPVGDADEPDGSRLRIVADDLEGRSVVCQKLAVMAGVRLEICRLAAGDYEVEG